jgi:hypothetical protein
MARNILLVPLFSATRRADSKISWLSSSTLFQARGRIALSHTSRRRRLCADGFHKMSYSFLKALSFEALEWLKSFLRDIRNCAHMGESDKRAIFGRKKQKPTGDF